MENKAAIIFFLLLPMMGILLSCGPPKYVAAPKGALPNRDQLPMDVYGGYIDIKTKDSVSIMGELIGMRNDSVFILGDSIKAIPRTHVVKARVIVHMPNNYKGTGFLLMGISSLVIVHAGEFGGAPTAMALNGVLFNGIGLGSAVGTEEKKINYFDWWEGWEKVILYSRFPHGIPTTVNPFELKGRAN